MAPPGIIGPGHPVAVALPGSDTGHVDVPDVLSALRNGDAPLFVPVEQAQLDALRVGRKESKVDALTVPHGA